ncbi:MAG TPA: hypothetical protein VES69_04520 [Pyrinomonadaceae bacterium]|nr:hypothetical protein [Pyrinomonadaceae bacterium]
MDQGDIDLVQEFRKCIECFFPLKERVVDDYYDPVRWFLRKLKGRKQ